MTQPDHEEQTEVIAEGRYRPKECASRQKRRAAAELFAAGIGYTKASRILDLPVNTLRDWAKAWKAGKFTEDISKHLYRYDDEVREKAVRMRLTGHTWRAIQNETGASAVSVRRWIEQYTLKGGRKKGFRLGRMIWSFQSPLNAIETLSKNPDHPHSGERCGPLVIGADEAKLRRRLKIAKV